MANGTTRDWSQLDTVLRAGRRVVWLDYLAYARRLFASDTDIWAEVGPFVEVVRQAQQLLESEVIEVPLDPFFAASAAPGGSPRANRPARAVRRLLSESAPLQTALGCVRAVKSLFARVPVVLVVGSGSDWLSAANGPDDGAGSAWEDDDIDATAMYLADAVRNFSDAGVSGVALDARGEHGRTAAELVDLHRPVFNVAGHSNWHRGVVTDRTAVDDLPDLAGKVDFVLAADLDLAALGETDHQVLVGGGLHERFWHEPPPHSLPDTGLCYGTVPEDAGPEEVLARLKHVRATS
jgi:hypothetical protein